MKIKATVLNVYNTSIGLVLEVGFNEKVIPSLGDVFEQDKITKWRIIGRGRDRKDELGSVHEEYKHYESVWDCRVESIGGSNQPMVNDILDLVT